VLRLYSAANFGVTPKSIVTDLETQAPNFSRWAEAVRAHPSVNGIYDEAKWVETYKARIAKARAA
jgi:glutathione S-transferase